MTMPPGCAPPLIELGEITSDFSAVGWTVSWPDADPPLRLAVIVTGVGDATCPAGI